MDAVAALRSGVWLVDPEVEKCFKTLVLFCGLNYNGTKACCQLLPEQKAMEMHLTARFLQLARAGMEKRRPIWYVKATPRNCVCEPQPSFCPTSSV